MSERLQKRIAFWQKTLRLTDYSISVEKIPFFLVEIGEGDWEKSQVSKSIMGVCDLPQVLQNKHIPITCTREPQHDDLVHELLHVKHPNWDEVRIVAETDRVLQLHQRRFRRFAHKYFPQLAA